MSSSPFARLPSDRSRFLSSDVNSYKLDDMTPSEGRNVSLSSQPSSNHLQNTKDSPKDTIGYSEASNSISHSGSGFSERLTPVKTPPSITRSIMLRKPITEAKAISQDFRGRKPKPDQLLALHRREMAVQIDIQNLLDAQSTALLKGYGDNGEELSDISSRTSSNKKVKNASYSGVIPVRQPIKKLIGLRGARNGIIAKMEELIYIKREELTFYEYEISIRNEAIAIAKNWEMKLIKLNKQLRNYYDYNNVDTWKDEDTQDGESEFIRLKEEEIMVKIKIRQLENELIQMKAKHECIKKQIDESANKKEARLSSYRGALQNAELEIKEFLKNPPVLNTIVMGEEDSFTMIPIGKRSLIMAIEWWKKESAQASLSKQKAEEEKTALEDGIQVWEESVQIVTNFESDLREKIKSERAMDIVDFEDQITKIDSIIKKLEENLHTVTRKGWNLLICAIGAELEALEKGQKILKESLKISKTESSIETRPFNSNNTSKFFNDIDGVESIRQNLAQELTENDSCGISSFHNHTRDSV